MSGSAQEGYGQGSGAAHRLFPDLPASPRNSSGMIVSGGATPDLPGSLPGYVAGADTTNAPREATMNRNHINMLRTINILEPGIVPYYQLSHGKRSATTVGESLTEAFTLRVHPARARHQNGGPKQPQTHPTPRVVVNKTTRAPG